MTARNNPAPKTYRTESLVSLSSFVRLEFAVIAYVFHAALKVRLWDNITTAHATTTLLSSRYIDDTIGWSIAMETVSRTKTDVHTDKSSSFIATSEWLGGLQAPIRCTIIQRIPNWRNYCLFI